MTSKFARFFFSPQCFALMPRCLLPRCLPSSQTRGRLSAGPPRNSHMTEPSLREDAIERIRARLAAGFDAPDVFLPNTIERLSEDYDGAGAAEIQRVVDEV